jgi:hypothetical protein
MNLAWMRSLRILRRGGEMSMQDVDRKVSASLTSAILTLQTDRE